MRSAGPLTARPPISGLTATHGTRRALERGADLLDREDRPDRDVRVARRDHDQVGRVERLEHAGRGARLGARPRSGRRRPRRGARARRTTPGTGTSRPASRRTCAGGRRSPAAARTRARARARAARSPSESGAPARSACVRTRCRPMSRSPSRNHASPPSVAAGRERVPGLVGAAPAALLVGDARERVEDRCRGRARRAGPSTSTSSPTLPIDGDVGRIDDRDDAAQEARAADAAREHGHLHAAAPARSVARTLRVRGPSRAAQTLEVGERVDVVDEIRRVAPSASGAERGEPLGAARPVDRREQPGRGERERVRRPVGRRREREPAVGNGAREREQVARRDARQVGVDDEQRPAPPAASAAASRPARTAAPWPPPGSATSVAPAAARGARGRRADRRRTSGRPPRRRRRTSASIAARERRPGVARERAEPALALRTAERDDQRRHRRGHYPPGAPWGAATGRVYAASAPDPGARRPTRGGRTSAWRAAPRRRAGRCARR